MSTSVETLFVPVRYYTAQDIYYYQVDNRPLQDIVTNLTTLAETSDTLSQTVTGVADISLASGVSVSIPEASGQNAVIVLTGTLTSPCTAVFPSGGNQSWVINNQTNEDVYVSYVGSTNSTLLESGYIARFYTDGTNMVGNVPAGLDQANTFSQPQVFAGTVDVSGGATFASTLDVSGGATFASTLDVSGGATLASTLDVSGGATFASTLDVSGGATFAGVLTAEKNATFSENINVNLNASVGSMANYGVDTVYTPVTSPSSTGDITITAAMLANGLVSRSGPTAAFTDTLDSGSNLNNYLSNTSGTNQGFRFVYVNTTAFVATIAAGTDITIVGPATVDGNSVREFVVVQTGGTTFSFYALGQGSSGPAVTSGGLTQLSQVLNVAPVVGNNVASIAAAATITATTGTLTAPCDGMAIVFGIGSQASFNGEGESLTSSLAGLVVQETTGGNPATNEVFGYLPMTTGQSSTFSLTTSNGSGATNYTSSYIQAFFVPNP